MGFPGGPRDPQKAAAGAPVGQLGLPWAPGWARWAETVLKMSARNKYLDTLWREFFNGASKTAKVASFG